MPTLRYNSVNSVIIEAAMQVLSTYIGVSNMPTLRYNSVNSVIIEAAMQVLST